MTDQLTTYCRGEIARLTTEIAAMEQQIARLMSDITARRGGIAAYEDVLRESAKEESHGLDGSGVTD